MHNLHEGSADTVLNFLHCPLPTPLSQELPVTIKNGYSAIAEPVANINIAVARINPYAGRPEERCVAGI